VCRRRIQLIKKIRKAASLTSVDFWSFRYLLGLTNPVPVYGISTMSATTDPSDRSHHQKSGIYVPPSSLPVSSVDEALRTITDDIDDLHRLSNTVRNASSQNGAFDAGLEAVLSSPSSNTQPSRLALPKYKHFPIRTGDAMRLLILKPAWNSDAELECDLEEVEFKREPSYEAVSWCWGLGPFDRRLRIRDGPEIFSFPLSANLESLLRHLRFSDKIRTLWIDAICINMYDAAEKNSQVSKMAQIFSGATSVCVWLGEGDELSNRAFVFLGKLVQNLWDFEEYCKSASNTADWAALASVMNRPWFSRRWVVQEIALAKDATLHCGESTISWQDFSQGISLLTDIESMETARSSLSDLKGFGRMPDFLGHLSSHGAVQLVKSTNDLFRQSIQPLAKDDTGCKKGSHGEKQPLANLEYLVCSLSALETSDPRDAVYALLAIARDTQPGAKGYITSLPYQVDYRRPVLDVYTDFIQFSVTGADPSRALDIICRPWAPPNRRDELTMKTPSWICDVSRAAFGRIDSRQGGQWHGPRTRRKNADTLVGLPGSGKHYYYNAAGSKTQHKQVIFHRRPTYYSMVVQGFVLDEVGPTKESSQSGNIPKGWPQFVGWNRKTDDPPDEFWRTIVADRGPGGSNAKVYYRRACKEAYNMSVEHESLDTQTLIHAYHSEVFTQFVRRVQAVVWNRRLIRTESLGRIALAHEHVERGDLVCILYGCSVPVILRRVQISSYQRVEEREHNEREEEAATKIQIFWRAKEEQRKRHSMTLRPARLGALQKPGQKDVRLGTHQREYIRLGAGVLFLLALIYSWTLPTFIFDLVTMSVAIALATLGLFGLLMPYVNAKVGGFQDGAPNTRFTKTVKDMARMIGEQAQKPPARSSEKTGENPDCYYELIGECYIHGMMDGEAISYRRSKQIETQTFDIR